MSEGKLSFKEMCAKFEVTPRTLRYYEYIELLSPERVGRSRFYGARECARMTLILRGRKFGFQLEELRQWLLIYDKEGTDAQMHVFIDMADRKLIELFEQQKQLAETIKELEELLNLTKKSLENYVDVTFVYVNVNFSSLSIKIKQKELQMSDPLTIREMCVEYGVTARTLRFYEAKELLFPIRDGQRRLFTKRDQARLKLIIKGKRFGFSLEEIRHLLDLYDMGDQQQTQLVKTYELAKERLKQLESQHYELGETIKELKEQLVLGKELMVQAKLSYEPAE